MDLEANDGAPIRPTMASAPGDDRPTAPGANSSVDPAATARNLAGSSTVEPALPSELTVRAENVLKGLAVELTGENPAQGRWTPSDLLLQKLTYKDVATARNCGPQTTAEIIAWARARGKILERSFHAGKSLSAMWEDTIARFATGEISKAEVADALENSTRRRNTRIPVAFQRILLQLVRSPND